jgi:hypothetical protein
MSLKGKKNVYTCTTCGFDFVTIDRDVGTTPFMTSCKNPKLCKGQSRSSFYSVDQNLVATYEWYAPDQREIRDIIKPRVLQHIAMGGLLLRKIETEKAA